MSLNYYRYKISFQKFFKKNVHKKNLIVSPKKRFFYFSFLLFLLLVIHTVGMIIFERMSVFEAIWVTLTTITTVGYGDLFPKTLLGELTTIVCLYLFGITIFAQTIAIYFEYQQEKKNEKHNGKWRWKMKNHIVFLNSPEISFEDYFLKLILQIRLSQNEISRSPMIIVSDKIKNLSDQLKKQNVVHVNYSPLSDEALKSASIDSASIIVILVREQGDIHSDSINFDLVDRLRSKGINGRILVEVIDDDNRGRLKKIGANSVFRPIRSYPELIARSILSPGSELILENLFDSYGEECIRYDINLKANWIDIVTILVKNYIGTPIAYESQTGEIITNPLPDYSISLKAMFIIVRSENIVSSENLENLLAQYKN